MGGSVNRELLESSALTQKNDGCGTGMNKCVARAWLNVCRGCMNKRAFIAAGLRKIASFKLNRNFTVLNCIRRGGRGA